MADGFSATTCSRNPVGGHRCLERRGKQTHRLETTGAQAADQGGDRGGVCRGQVSAVEGNEDPFGHAFKRGFHRDYAPIRTPRATFGQGLGAHHRSGIEPRRQRHLCQGGLCRDLAAGIAQMRQPPQSRDRQGGIVIQPRILAPVCGQHRQRDALGLRQRQNLLQPIRPVGHAADQPDQDALGALQRLFDIGVDRQRVFQRRQIRQPQGRHSPLGVRRHDASPPRKRQGRCPKTTAPPDPPGSGPGRSGSRFPRARGFRGRRRAWLTRQPHAHPRGFRGFPPL